MDLNPARMDAALAPRQTDLSGFKGSAATPKYEQRPLVSEFSTVPSLTRAHTNMPPNDAGAGSLYSYQPPRDVASFLKSLHGRWARHLLRLYLNENKN